MYCLLARLLACLLASLLIYLFVCLHVFGAFLVFTCLSSCCCAALFKYFVLRLFVSCFRACTCLSGYLACEGKYLTDKDQMVQACVNFNEAELLRTFLPQARTRRACQSSSLSGLPFHSRCHHWRALPGTDRCLRCTRLSWQLCVIGSGGATCCAVTMEGERLGAHRASSACGPSACGCEGLHAGGVAERLFALRGDQLDMGCSCALGRRLLPCRGGCRNRHRPLPTVGGGSAAV